MVCANPRQGGGKGGQERPGPTWVEGATLAPTLPTPPGPGTLAHLALEQGPPERPRQIAPRGQPGLSTALWPIRPRAVGPAASVSQSVSQSVSLCDARGHYRLSRPSPRRVQCSAVQCQYLRTQTQTQTRPRIQGAPSHLRAPPLTPMALSPTATECVAAQGPGRGRGETERHMIPDVRTNFQNLCADSLACYPRPLPPMPLMMNRRGHRGPC